MKIVVLNGSLSSYLMVPELCKYYASQGEKFGFFIPTHIHSPFGVTSAIGAETLIDMLRSNPFLPSPEFTLAAKASSKAVPLVFNPVETNMRWIREVNESIIAIHDRCDTRVLQEHGQDGASSEERQIVDMIGESYEIVLPSSFVSGTTFQAVKAHALAEHQLTRLSQNTNEPSGARPVLKDIHAAFNTLSKEHIANVTHFLDETMANALAGVDKWLGIQDAYSITEAAYAAYRESLKPVEVEDKPTPTKSRKTPAKVKAPVKVNARRSVTKPASPARTKAPTTKATAKSKVKR